MGTVTAGIGYGLYTVAKVDTLSVSYNGVAVTEFN